MLQFVVTNIFLLSLGVILYVSIRTLPRIDERAMPEKKGAWERWLSSGVPEKIDRILNSFLFKTLRRLKVFLLRTDNAINAWLQKIKPEGNGSQKPGIDFQAIKGDNSTKEDQV